MLFYTDLFSDKPIVRVHLGMTFNLENYVEYLLEIFGDAKLDVRKLFV